MVWLAMARDGTAIPQAQRNRYSHDSTRSHSSFPGSYHRVDTIGPDSHLATTPEINASPSDQPGRESPSSLDRRKARGVLQKSRKFHDVWKESGATKVSSGSAKW
jgi:hypothetical protein